MLDPSFPCYTPGSRRFYDFEDAGELQLLTAEVRRTLDAIASAAPARIAKGQLTKDQAEAEAVLWLAIAEDLEAQDQWLIERQRGVPAWHVDQRLRALRSSNAIAWEDKVAALRREIEARRSGYEAAIAKGQLTRDQANQQLERLEAAHDLYWRHGYAFDGSRDELAAMTDTVLDALLDRQEQTA